MNDKAGIKPLYQIRDELRSECNAVEADSGKYPELAHTTPAWMLGDWADDIEAIIQDEGEPCAWMVTPFDPAGKRFVTLDPNAPGAVLALVEPLYGHPCYPDPKARP